MAELLAGIRVVLAVVLLWSGVAKLRDLSASREAAARLGIPAPFNGPVGSVLPLAELAIAAALLPTATARGAGWAAGGLFAAFAILVGGNLLVGRRPACNCFGAGHDAPISGWTLGRNLALTAMAVTVALGESLGVGATVGAVWSLVSGSTAAAVAGVAVVIAAVQTVVLLRLLRRYGAALVRLESLDTAAGMPKAAAGPAPAFTLADVAGRPVSLATLRGEGRRVLLVFADTACGPCHDLLPDIALWQRTLGPGVPVAVVATGDRGRLAADAAAHGLVDVLFDADGAVSRSYRLNGTPSAVLIEADGTAGPPVAGAPAIRAVVARMGSALPVLPARLQRGSQVGTAAPAFRLPQVGGGEVALVDYTGRDVVVVFWDPACAFCQQLRADLVAAARAAADTGLVVLVVSKVAASSPADAELAAAATLLLDPGGTVMRAYGASGTPMAVRVGAAGVVMSELAAGAAAVLALLATPALESAPAVAASERTT